MERLTYKENGKWRLRIGDTELIGKETDRLAAYEDTGLAPGDCAAYKKFEDNLCSSGVTFSRIIELVNAEKAKIAARRNRRKGHERVHRQRESDSNFDRF
jgi:hypothetical protein